MNLPLRWRLAIMMALLYAVQGSWFPLLAVHLNDLGISGRVRGWIFATFSIGCLAAPLGFGQIADRYLPAQRLLSLIYLVGAVLLTVIASGWVTTALPLFALFLIYWLTVAPAMGLSSTIALRNLPRPREQFGRVRLWGTVGWMVAGWIVAQVMAWNGSDQNGGGAFEAFAVGAIIAATLSVFAVSSLPHTPPLATGSGQEKDKGWSEAAADAKALVGRPIVALYLITAFFVAMTLPYMFQVQPTYLEATGLPRQWIAPAMTLGQMLEIVALGVLPWCLQRWGFRGTLAIGIGAWALRYGSLAIGPPLWLAVGGIPLHGIGIGWFVITGQMFLDSQAPPHRRASAQGLNTMLTAGIGALTGSLIAGEIVNRTGEGNALCFAFPFLINAGLLVLWISLSRKAARVSHKLQASAEPRLEPEAVAERE